MLVCYIIIYYRANWPIIKVESRNIYLGTLEKCILKLVISYNKLLGIILLLQFLKL